MGLIRRLTTASVMTLLILAAVPAQAAAGASCATGQEAEALRVRALQSKLMVAALACGEHDRYDAFVGRFGETLSAQGRVMNAYFTRRHTGKRVSRVIDDYVTTQANQHSLDSMADRAAFCRAAGETLSGLLVGTEETLRAASATIPDNRVESPLACLREARMMSRTSGG